MPFYKSLRPTAAQWGTAAICVLGFCGILLHPKPTADGVRQGLLLCAEVVLPALFPFTVAALLLFKTNLFTKGKRGQWGVFLLSMVAGYPVGARLVRALYAQGGISQSQAWRMVCYCQNAGPAFIVLAVGAGIYGRADVGWLLLVAHLSAAVGLRLLLQKTAKDPPFTPSPTPTPPFYFGNAFVEATAEGAQAMFSVCGWVTLCSALGNLLTALPLPEILKDALTALAEITTGVTAVRPLGLCAVAALLGFGGFCVQFQVLAGAGEARPPLGKFLLCRLLHGGLSAGIMRVLLLLFPLKQAVSTFGQAPARFSNAASVPAAISLLFLCAVFLGSLKQEA